jgi:serine/threonine-protein kinase
MPSSRPASRSRRTLLQTADRLLDDYASRWVAMSVESCQATRRGEQSQELLDLREVCLSRQRAGLLAITQLLSRADDKIVSQASAMAYRLAPLDDCADVTQLRAVVKPPKDLASRARIDELDRAIATAHQLAEAEKVIDARTALPRLDVVQNLGYRPLEARFLLVRGLIAFRGSDLAHSSSDLTDAILAAQAAGDHKLAIDGWLALMGDLEDKHKYDEARLAGRHASALLERIGGNARLEARLLIYQGWLEAYAGDEQNGWPYFDRALEIRKRSLEPDDPDLLESLQLEAQGLARQHHFEASLAALQRVLAARERVFGPDGPLVAWSLYWIGSTQHKLGDFRGMIASFERALAIYERNGLDSSAPTLLILEGLAIAHAKIGEFQRAVDYATRAVAQGEAVAAKRTPSDLTGALNTYSRVLHMQGDDAQAVIQSERALRVVEGSLPQNNGLFIRWWTQLGIARLGAGRTSEAVVPLERALALADANPALASGDDSASTRFALARALRTLHRDEPRARTLATKAREIWATSGRAMEQEIAEVDRFLAASPGQAH